MIVAIGVMIVIWAVVLAFRQDIRVRWWGYRLAHTSAIHERVRYLQLLVNSGERSLPVGAKLVANADPAVRSHGVALLTAVKSGRSAELLGQACRDPDPDIRHMAVFGLSVQPVGDVPGRLVALADSPDVDVATAAVSGLVNVGTPAALAALGDMARRHANAAVRAQAIESLGQWGGPEAAAVLRECLADEAVFAGPTQMELGAWEALRVVAPGQAAADGGAGATAALGLAPRTNGERAAAALEALEAEGEREGPVTSRPSGGTDDEGQ